jgi:spore germination cell wall hydrolase CwlJ-like protein
MSLLTLPRPKLAAVSGLLRRAPRLLRHAPALSVLGVMSGLYVVAGASLAASDAAVEGEASRAAERVAGLAASPPAPQSDPTALIPISADEALLRNAAIPIAEGPNPAATAFTLPADEVARMRSIDCLTAAVYYEAGLESIEGQKAVAQVVLNRVRHPHYPNTVCGVVFQGHQRTTGCQFTFTCDGSLRRTPAAHLWARSRKVAEEALSGYVHRPVGWATHYHANYVLPYWAPTLSKVATIGAHIFYRWDGYGRATVRYAGAEPDIRWRGGFGQPDQTVLAGAAAPVDPRDAAAAAAAATAAAEQKEPGQAPHSVDSFQRAVLRRYEPTTTARANQIIRDNVQNQSASSRWAMGGAGGDQAPLGRRDGAPVPPVQLEGVRRRPATAAPPAQNATQPREP